MKTGIELIAEERRRQVEQEGWTAEHDDGHGSGQLGLAGVSYALAGVVGASQNPPAIWPFNESWWKPSDNPIPNLVKAGALIAAEIDRLQRAEKGGG